MRESEPARVVAATSVRSVEVIDGGDTVAVRLAAAGEGETCILLPAAAVGSLLYLLAEALIAQRD